MFKFNKIYFIFLYFLLINSCGLLKEDNGTINYRTIDFNNYTPPKAPSYDSVDDWLVHPDKDQNEYSFLEKNNNLLKADVFFVVPTLFADKKNIAWNSDVYDTKFSKILIESSIKYQATAWMDAGNLYSPNYRQAHFRVFDERFRENGGKKAYDLAYQDIKRSFEVYLKKYNNGKPIIIAGHSQGSAHLVTLLKEFFDGKNLKKKLIAAYLPGTIIRESDFFDLELMSSEDETGGYLTWNTFKVLKNEEKYNLTIERIYLNNAQVSNPITWNEYISKDINDHKGFLWLNQKVFSNAVIIESIDEALNIKTPKMGFPKSILVSFLKDYHKGDINLFWEDIRLNSIKRVQNSFKNLQN